MKIKLKDLCISITDGEHGSIKDNNNGEYYLLSNKNIVNNNIVITNNDRRIDKDTFLKIDRRTKIDKNDVVISTVGTLGKTAVLNGIINYTFQRSVGIIKTNKEKLNPYFLKYLLDTKEYQTKLIHHSKGAVQKCLFIDDLKNLELDIPNINIQNNIAKLLNKFDSKIRMNNQINNNLEELMQTLYQRWFIEFNFPNEEGRPYKSSGGKMVWNEELKQEIPEGWDVKEIKEFVSKDNRKYESKSITKTIDLSVMPSSSISINEFNLSNKFSSNLNIMKEGNILFGSIRPYLNKAGIAPYNGAVAGTVYSYEVLNDDYYNFILITLTNSRMFNFALSRSKGTRMPVISSDDLLSYKVPYNSKIAKKFNKFIIKDIICKNVQENQKLTELRDFLLPMLMNGQINVDDVEI